MFSKEIKRRLLEDCEVAECDIRCISKREALDEILNYEGIIGWTNTILSLIEDIWDIELEC